MTTTRQTPVDSSAEDPRTTPDSRASARGGSWRPLLTRLHFYAGVLVAPFVLVAAFSGMLYALSPQLESVVHDRELHTDARGPALPLDRQVEIARQEQPDLPLLAVRPAAEPGQTTQVLFDDGRTEESRRLGVFVDPVEGDVHGELTSYGSSGSLPVRTWIDELHRELQLGEPGRVYAELAASWLWVVALGGVALWWGGRRRRREARGPWIRSRLRPARGVGPRRRTLSWHGAIGTWVVLGMLMLSATGLTWSKYAGQNVTDLRAALDWSTPTVVADLESQTGSGAGQEGHLDHGGQDGQEGHEGHAGSSDEGGAATDDGPQEGSLGLQEIWDVAAQEDLQGPVEVAEPLGPTGTYVVQEVGTGWPTQADAVAVDPTTGEVVDVVRFEDYPLAAKLATWGIDLHMGLLFGVWNQVALVALASAIIAMIVWGYRMWWQRRPTRGGSWAMGRPARRGAWRSVHPAGLVALVLVAAAVGWALPVLGVSLLAFLVLDAVLGVVRRRRPRASSGRSKAARGSDTDVAAGSEPADGPPTELEIAAAGARRPGGTQDRSS